MLTSEIQLSGQGGSKGGSSRAVFLQQQSALMLGRHEQRPWGQLALGSDLGLSLTGCVAFTKPSILSLLLPSRPLHVLFPLLECSSTCLLLGSFLSGLGVHIMSEKASLVSWLHIFSQPPGFFL